MSPFEYVFMESMQRNLFRSIVNDNFDFLDSIIDEEDIEKANTMNNQNTEE